MKRFVEGEDRTQVTLLPECLDDYIEAENPVRVIEVFVDELDLGELGIAAPSCCHPPRCYRDRGRGDGPSAHAGWHG